MGVGSQDVSADDQFAKRSEGASGQMDILGKREKSAIDDDAESKVHSVTGPGWEEKIRQLNAALLRSSKLQDFLPLWDIGLEKEINRPEAYQTRESEGIASPLHLAMQTFSVENVLFLVSVGVSLTKPALVFPTMGDNLIGPTKKVSALELLTMLQQASSSEPARGKKRRALTSIAKVFASESAIESSREQLRLIAKKNAKGKNAVVFPDFEHFFNAVDEPFDTVKSIDTEQAMEVELEEAPSYTVEHGMTAGISSAHAQSKYTILSTAFVATRENILQSDEQISSSSIDVQSGDRDNSIGAEIIASTPNTIEVESLKDVHDTMIPTGSESMSEAMYLGPQEGTSTNDVRSCENSDIEQGNEWVDVGANRVHETIANDIPDNDTNAEALNQVSVVSRETVDTLGDLHAVNNGSEVMAGTRSTLTDEQIMWDVKRGGNVLMGASESNSAPEHVLEGQEEEPEGHAASVESARNLVQQQVETQRVLAEPDFQDPPGDKAEPVVSSGKESDMLGAKEDPEHAQSVRSVSSLSGSVPALDQATRWGLNDQNDKRNFLRAMIRARKAAAVVEIDPDAPANTTVQVPTELNKDDSKTSSIESLMVNSNIESAYGSSVVLFNSTVEEITASSIAANPEEKPPVHSTMPIKAQPTSFVSRTGDAIQRAMKKAQDVTRSVENLRNRTKNKESVLSDITTQTNGIPIKEMGPSATLVSKHITNPVQLEYTEGAMDSSCREGIGENSHANDTRKDKLAKAKAESTRTLSSVTANNSNSTRRDLAASTTNGSPLQSKGLQLVETEAQRVITTITKYGNIATSPSVIGKQMSPTSSQASMTTEGHNKIIGNKVDNPIGGLGGQSAQNVQPCDNSSTRITTNADNLSAFVASPVQPNSDKNPDDNYIMSEPESDEDEEVLPTSSESKKMIPEWARGALLEQTIHAQFGDSGEKIDPDTIFPFISTCDLDLIFGRPTHKQLRRGSSGLWEQDKLTQLEIERYRIEMGFDTL